ncbi:DUF3703 domain-containing protein [Variovorax sp. PCZ-1]|uniref:DUF3703 domain-containing protein n=1 Tax=Variovorax sp. PCZ-1 TaxID=2835533 RepID=UPI001BCFCBB0|nr:DUF3703 domain-containing protein [Variovorax sp. PCZ-1]MBS7807958.1 DUF3703 domain-containing protein [Variovorax sp. PCZ-1]
MNKPSVANKQVGWLLEQAMKEPRHSSNAWPWLEAAHIVGQTRFVLHGRVHLQMLSRAWTEHAWKEVFAQLLRLALVPLGHLLQRLPLGNPGSSRVGALTPMPVPVHLTLLIEQSRAILVKESK